MVELPEEVGGAIRMVAFGVLEHVRPRGEEFRDLFGKHSFDHEVEALVCKDLHALGWKLAALANRTGQFILLGRAGGSAALPVRPKIAQGTLQEVCIVAVDWLDNGPQPSPKPVR